jgi:hypothetical protein
MKETLQKALDALGPTPPDCCGCKAEWQIAIYAIKEALAQPEQEPVAFASHGVVNWIADKQFQHEALLYSAPQRTWVGLTDEDRFELAKAQHGWEDLCLAVEAKLRDKNESKN